ncbi:MAG: hypothetical protein M1823_000865 [Watsoniomyces obsoletus]|nr:MAG: hypothetical protein M1823_000865 [Watsoniomyces obsoletus]
MAPANLEKASKYINNLLLSRGLLRDGQPINFFLSTSPSTPNNDSTKSKSTETQDHEKQKQNGNETASAARIINLIHDLILRRDREAESREELGTTIRKLQSSSTKKDIEIERLRSQNIDLERQLSSAHSLEQTLKNNIHAAENAARGVREEMQRVRSTLHQVRLQAANDLRNREGEIKRLRTHLEAKQRGGGRVVSGTTPSGAGGVGAGVKAPADAAPSGPSPPPPTPGSRGLNISAEARRRHTLVPLESPEYHLSQESPEFLAQLCQSLSDENDNLIGLMRSSVMRLRDIQGLGNAQAVAVTATTVDGNDGTTDDVVAPNTTKDETELHTTSIDELANEMKTALEHLQKILTNPSFVPLEEVQVREEEIVRLRLGWQKMECKWKEAVSVMDAWRRRIADDGTLMVNGEDMSPMKNGVDDDGDLMMSSMRNGGGHGIPEEEEEDEEQDVVVVDNGTELGLDRASRDSKRKRQASSQLASPSKRKIAKATVGQKLSEAQAEAEEEEEGSRREHHDEENARAGTNDSMQRPQQKPQRNGSMLPKRLPRPKPKKKRDTLSPEELEYLLGVS